MQETSSFKETNEGVSKGISLELLFFFWNLFCGKMPTPKFSAFVKSLPCVGSIVTVCKNIIWIHWMLLVYSITGILTLCRELTCVYLFIYFAVVDFRWLPVVLIFPMCVMWWTLICQLTLRSMFTVLAVLVVLDTQVMSPLQIKRFRKKLKIVAQIESSRMLFCWTVCSWTLALPLSLSLSLWFVLVCLPTFVLHWLYWLTPPLLRDASKLIMSAVVKMWEK